MKFKKGLKFKLFFVICIVTYGLWLWAWFPDRYWNSPRVSTEDGHTTPGNSTGEVPQGEVIEQSEKYVRELAHDTDGVVNGPYDDTVDAGDPLQRNHGECELTAKERQLYPQCLAKLRWMADMWRSDPCYAAHGVDGSMCSFIMYLSEVEGWCPRTAWQGSLHAPTEDPTNIVHASINVTMDGLMALLVDPNERHANAFMRLRISRLWQRWAAAIVNLDTTQDLSKRRHKKVLFHLGLLTRKAGYGFAEKQFKGGPLGELVQWSDLITGLYVLGHELTVTTEEEQLPRILAPLTAANATCRRRKYPPFDLIYTDIIGLQQLKTSVRHGFDSFRIVDSFGTEPAFNLRSFANQRKKLSPWGGHDLQPQQFFTMFPHSPDNSFMGFVVEHSDSSLAGNITRGNMAVVYGKETYMWKDKKHYLDTIHGSGIEIHATVYTDDSKDKSKHNIPSYVINHGLLNGDHLHKLLRQTKIFIGMGFPIEGPAPLEAIANGAVFLNAKLRTPHNRTTKAFFQGKPTERKLTSQHPYAEQFIGEPYVYTINIQDTEEVRTTVQKILDANNI